MFLLELAWIYVRLHEMMLFSPSNFLTPPVPRQEGTSGYSQGLWLNCSSRLISHPAKICGESYLSNPLIRLPKMLSAVGVDY